MRHSLLRLTGPVLFLVVANTAAAQSYMDFCPTGDEATEAGRPSDGHGDCGERGERLAGGGTRAGGFPGRIGRALREGGAAMGCWNRGWIRGHGCARRPTCLWPEAGNLALARFDNEGHKSGDGGGRFC